MKKKKTLCLENSIHARHFVHYPQVVKSYNFAIAFYNYIICFSRKLISDQF